MNAKNNRTSLVIGIIAILLTSVLLLPANAQDSKVRLISTIDKQQKQCEAKIVSLWMSGNRGKELEMELSEYVTLEVRKGALIDHTKGSPTLLGSISSNEQFKPENPLGIAKEIVLEHFKNRGIDLRGQKFVKGTYYIQVNR